MVSRSLAGAGCVAAWLLVVTPIITQAASAVGDTSQVALPPRQVRHWQVGLLRHDRIQHASLSFTISLAAGLLSHQPGIGVAAGLGLGIAKELADLRGSGFDGVDLMADVLGTGAGAWASAAIEH